MNLLPWKRKQTSMARSWPQDTTRLKRLSRSKRTTMYTGAGTKLKDRSALTRPFVRTEKRRIDWLHNLALACAFVGSALLWMTIDG